MKAAVLKEYGTLPVYEDYPEPLTHNLNEKLVTPLASSIKRLDIGKAAGTHYTKFDKLPAVMGMDGIAETDDGSKVYALGITGMMAEKAVVDRRSMIKIPAGLSNAMAAAMPNVLMGSDLALTVRGKIQKGDVVLIDGATGATGTMAVQAAKLRGASWVIATGRNQRMLNKLATIGADVTISLKQSDSEIIKQIRQAYKDNPFTIIADYLWGHPAELIFKAIHGVSLEKLVKYLTIGQMAGASIELSSGILRSQDIFLYG